MSSNEVLISETDTRGVITLTLNRATRRNALNGALMTALISHLKALAVDPDCRVVVITGSGEVFCSGADLVWVEEVVAAGDAANEADAMQLAFLMQAIHAFPKPVIARVNGPAYGGGIGLIACCDMAIGIDSASFAFSEVRLGLVAAVIAPYVLVAIGARQARHWMLTARRFDSAQAMKMGLLAQVIPATTLDDAIDTIVSDLLQGETQALTETKRLIAQLEHHDMSLMQQTATLTARLRATDAARQRMQDFLSRHGRKNDG